MMRKRKLRVLMLMDRDLVPPEDADGYSRADLQTAPWKMEYDVSATLHNLEHEVRHALRQIEGRVDLVPPGGPGVFREDPGSGHGISLRAAPSGG